jgi:hypothetical protein
MNIFESKDILTIKRSIFEFCKRKLNIEPSEDKFNEFKELMEDYDGNLRRSEYEYNAENIKSLKEVINENTLSKFKIFIEPKHDGTQIVMKVDNKVHMCHKNGSNIDMQDLALLFGIFSKYYNDFMKLIDAVRERRLIVKMEIFGKEYTPMRVEKEPLNFSVFDVLKDNKYLLPIEFDLPHTTEFLEVKKAEDINAQRVINWLKNKEGLMVKIYDETFSLSYKKARNFNLLAFKYKPLVNLIEDELKARRIKVDNRMLAIVISELLTEYAKNKYLTLNEMINSVKRDHEELREFIERNYEIIANFWNESYVVKSLLDIIT